MRTKRKKRPRVTCGYCKKSFAHVVIVMRHWKKDGCTWRRDVWARVAQAKRRGHSGRRILSETWPDLYPRKKMSQDVIDRLRGERK